MTNEPEPEDRNSLLLATILAAIGAALIAVLFVMPTEYGVDPTGVGGWMGLTDLSIDASGAVHGIAHEPWRNDTVIIVVPAGEGLEYKLSLAEDQGLVYDWHASAPIYTDFHGEPEAGPAGAFQSYQVGTQDAVAGSFLAPFAGTHGWYWENQGPADVTITLRTAGHYAVVGYV